MHKRPFTLTREAQCVRNVPDDGESMGDELARAAKHREEELRSHNGGTINTWAALRVGQMYHLAADAFELGAMVSSGHSRSDRYEAKAAELRRHAESLFAAA